MRHALLSPAARDDLAAIWGYTAETWGIAQAERYVREIQEPCAVLNAGTRRGKAVGDIRP